jgi:hypothetical protein
MTSADDAISAAQAATSAAVTSVNNRVSAISTQLTSVQSALSALSQANSADHVSIRNLVSIVSNAVSIVSAQVATNSSDFTSFKQSINNIGDVSTSAPTSTQILVYISATGQWINTTPVAGSGSVTSNEASAISAAAASGINTVSNAVSALSVQLSLQISALSQVISALSQTNSADHVSIRNLISIVSQAVSVVSAANAVTSAAVTSVNNRVSAISADLTSFKVSLNNLGDVSIDTPSDGQALIYRATSAQWVNSTIVAGSGSVTSNEVSAVSAAAASAISIVSAAVVSAMSIVSTLQWPAIETVTSATYSVVEADRGKIKYFTTATSIEVVLPNGLTSGFQAVIWRGPAAGIVRISATTSVESHGLALNAVNTAATIIHKGSNIWLAAGAFGETSTTVSALSSQISVLQSAVNTLSDQVSAAGGFQQKMVQDIQGISATGLTNISGLSVVLSAGNFYKIEAMIINRMSVANTYKFGATFPAMVSAEATGVWKGAISIGNNTSVRNGVFNHTASGSVTYSIAAAAAILPIMFDGLFHASATGSFQIQAAVSASGSPIEIRAGSYIKAYKIG